MNNWHKCIEAFKRDTKRTELDEWANLPVFVTDSSLYHDKDQLASVRPSFRAIVSAGLFFVPFDRFVIQEKISRPELLQYSASSYYMVSKEIDAGKEILRVSMIQHALKTDAVGMVFINLGLNWEGDDAYYSPPIWSVDKEQDVHFVGLSTKAISELVVALSTKGLTQVTEKAPEKLNKKRIANGKPPISDTIYIRATHYYDAQGKKHDMDERNPVKVHYRSAHLRHVRYGVGRTNVRRQLIKSCIVNFKPNDLPPEHKTRIIKR